MFERNTFQKTMNAFKKAESEVLRQRGRGADIDSSIREAEGKAAALSTRIDELNAEEGEFSALTAAIDEIVAEREGHLKRAFEYKRFREQHRVKEATAEIALLAAEDAVHAAQAEHYVTAADNALKAAVDACIGPIRALEVAASARAYHRHLGRGEDMARREWRDVDGLALLEAALRDPAIGLFDDHSIDEHPKGAPPVVAIRSEHLAVAARQVAGDLKGKNKLEPAAFAAALAAAQTTTPSSIHANPFAEYHFRREQAEKKMVLMRDRRNELESSLTSRKRALVRIEAGETILREGKRISAAEMRTIVEETAAEFDRFDKLYVEATVSLREINANPAPSTAVAA